MYRYQIVILGNAKIIYIYILIYKKICLLFKSVILYKKKPINISKMIRLKYV